MVTHPVQAKIFAALLLVAALAYALAIVLVPGTHSSWTHVLSCVAAAVFTVWIQGAMAACRLTVDDRGIRMDNRSGGVFGLRSWSLEWKDITRVTANARMGIVDIQRKGRVSALRIMVRQWTPGESTNAPAARSFFRRTDPTQTELWRVLQARGLFDPERYGAGRGVSDFDMGKHPATRWTLAAAFALVAYGIVDLAAHGRPEFLTAGAVGGALVAGLTCVLMFRVRRPYPVPFGITAVVAVFMAAGGMLATWAALSRFAA